MAQEFEATVTLKIEHFSGPELEPDRVRSWLADETQWFDGNWTGFTFEVCATCDDPAQCESEPKCSIARYIATVTTVLASDDSDG